MKRKYYSIIVIAIFMAAQIILFQNCGRDYGIKMPDAVTEVGDDIGGIGGGGEDNLVLRPPVCETTFIEEEGVVKIVFLIDASGSNSNANENTDPGKHWRSYVINSFRSAYATKVNFFYNLTTFKSDSATTHVSFNDNGVTKYFSNSIDTVSSAVTSFMNTSDAGNTPYKKATDKVKSMIQSDLAHGDDQDKYVVVMLSDGMPNPTRTTDQVREDVAEIVALADGRVSFNTIFYYNTNTNATAQERLQAMAEAGGGAYIVANSNQVLEIDDIIRIPQENCQ